MFSSAYTFDGRGITSYKLEAGYSGRKVGPGKDLSYLYYDDGMLKSATENSYTSPRTIVYEYNEDKSLRARKDNGDFFKQYYTYNLAGQMTSTSCTTYVTPYWYEYYS